MNRSALAVVVGLLGLFGCGGGPEGGTGGGSGGGSGGGTGSGGGGGGAAACSAANCTGCCLNGTCNAGSTNAGCGKNGAACVACGSQTICKADQSCGLDPEATWVVQPISATISTTNAGATWDFGSGAPDPYVATWCPADSATPSFTPTANDTFMPTWTTGGCSAKAKDLLSKGFALSVTDEDVSASDGISGKGTLMVTEAQLLSGQMTGITNNDTLVTLTVRFTKQ